MGNGTVDESAAIQRAVDRGAGALRFHKGTYRLTKTIEIDLDRVGVCSIVGDGVATFWMDGPGPAFRFVGTHRGTAAPATVQPAVWRNERTPLVDGIEIVGRHPESCGIEASGTMQLTLSRLTVRETQHAVHLVDRNRNVVLSQCHLYHNRGVGVFLDQLNLHQINIDNCHISYNGGGGVVAKNSEIRNLQIGTCDIEGNMGGPDSEPTANIWLDSSNASIGEVAIVGCTIQHTHDAPQSANIRINGRSTPRPFTDELRHGNVTIASNVLSDVQVNVELTDVRGAAITGNTLWKGYTANLLLRGCSQVVMTGNVLDRNPRYHYGDGAQAKLGVALTDCHDCLLSGNLFHGAVLQDAAISIRRSKRILLTGCSILDYGAVGIRLEDVSDSRISDCLIRHDKDDRSIALQQRDVRGTVIQPDLLNVEQDDEK
ncbi:right-handed parallel beta-helix repeat-containing protein [Roseiconus nitratireducens]|uniref:right-handed parallel beta-helix repeat-containing protein n=1 Tax=Roseiconus nitratireducens TaxID=2605748 RepID=UPI00191BFD6A|nr:right-handed parallel beta-helix repeat-containing protein [Roseiconus nitratireducens]